MKCGDFRPCFCTDCGGPSPGKDTCDRSTCVHCAPNWARRRATAVCRKLEALRAMLYVPGRNETKHHHLVISPPDDFRFEGDDALQRGFEACRDIMDELGIQGIVIYHPYRGADGDDRGFWKDILFNWQDWDDVQDTIRYSPHFHVIGVSEFVEGGELTKTVEAETGWVIERITKNVDDSNVSIGNNLDLARAVTYCLSHVGLYETDGGRIRYAARWYGADVQEATPPEKYRMEWERIVRTVSTKTLGLEKKDLLCGRASTGSTQVSIGRFDAAQARMRDDTSGSSGNDVDDWAAGHGNVDATGEVIIGSSGPVADQGTEMPDVPNVDVQVERDDEPCEGPLYDISRAPEFLEDDEWVEQAAYASQLQTEYERWQRTEDFLTHVNDDLEAIQDGRPEDARIDWPPPD